MAASMAAETKATTPSPEELLVIARQHIANGKPGEALGCVLAAVAQTRGEAGIVEVLDEARRAQGLSTSEDKQHLDSSSGVSSAQTQPSLQQDDLQAIKTRVKPTMGSILGQQGRTNVLQDAYDDGSSVLCRHCGGLIKRARMDAHLRHWCAAFH